MASKDKKEGYTERRTILLVDHDANPPAEYEVGIGNDNPGYIGLRRHDTGYVIAVRSGFVKSLCDAMRELAAKADRYPGSEYRKAKTKSDGK